MLCANLKGRSAAPNRKHRLAVAAVAALVLAAAVVFFVSLGGEAPPEIGDIIEFGGKGWLVLDVQEGGLFESHRVLIITQDIIGQRTYHGRWTSITWETNDIRNYLNNDFYGRFTAEERQRIAQTAVANYDNPWFGTPGGNDTTDKIFLLSLDELVKYFGDSGQLAHRNHPDNQPWRGFHDRYTGVRVAYSAEGPGWWWLRSPGFYYDNAANVVSDGFVAVGGLVLINSGGVRPALWLYI